jgi:GTP-binding protein
VRRRPLVAIVGRPNVGKSTLFNRLIGKRQAIVHDEPGLTRDRHYANAEYANKPFTIIDTGGYEDSTDSPLLRLMREQTLIAISEADAVIFLAEQAVPDDPVDAEIIQRLRESGKPFYLAVNKCDTVARENQAIADFSIYGLDSVYPVSALHGDGVLDLMDDLTADFEVFDPDAKEVGGPVHVALVGRQNAGKSTLTNRLLGQPRMIESDSPGTTRDAIDTAVKVDGEDFVLIDTAGIRRRGKIEHGAEKLSVHSSFAAIDRCDVAILLIDAAEGITAQDTHIAGYILEARKACVIVLNKWDIVRDRENYGEYMKLVREEFNFLRWAPVLTISAKTGQRANKIWNLVRHCADQYRRKFATHELNLILRKATAYVSPPIRMNKQMKLKYVTQTGQCPPKLTFFVNDPKLMHFSYERFLQNQFRSQLGLDGTPLIFRYKLKADESRVGAGAKTEEFPDAEEYVIEPIDLGEEMDWEGEPMDDEELQDEEYMAQDYLIEDDEEDER